MTLINKQQTAATKPTDVVKAYLAAFACEAWDEAVALLDKEVVWHVDGDVKVPTVGVLKGAEQVKTWLQRFPEHFTPQDFTLSEFIEQDNNVLVLGRFRHRIALTGNSVGSDMIIHFQVMRGKITRYQIFEDSALLCRAFNPHDDWQQQQIKLNGTVYHYRERGEGPTILFAHGLFADHTIFTEQVNRLSQHFRCILIDMPGHGQSGYDPEGWTLDAISQDFALMIQARSLGEVIFIGQSQGGMVGIRLAARYPECVSRLILIGTSARAEYPERLTEWQTRREILSEGNARDREEVLRAMQAQIYGEQALLTQADFLSKERGKLLALPPVGLALAIDAAVFTRGDIRALLPSVAIPALILCGEEDRATPVALSQEIAEAMPFATLVLIAGAGHHPVVDAAREVTEAIERFLLPEGNV